MKMLFVRWATGALILSFSLSALSAESKPTAPSTPEKIQERAELERKLEDAQDRLDVAAREVAELSMSLSEGRMQHRGFTPVRRNQAVLGIAISAHEDVQEGVKIRSVSPGGGAANAGLLPGDVLVELNGQPLVRETDRSSQEKLRALMAEIKPGDRVNVRYRRAGGTLQDAQIETQPLRDHVFAIEPARVHPMPSPPPHVAFLRAAGVFGSAELVALTPKLGQYFGTEKGLLVVRAPEDARLKLEEGDVILDIDGRTPDSSSHALRILSSYKSGEKLRMHILRAKKKVSLDVTVPEDVGEPMERFRPSGAVGVPAARAMPEPLPPPGAPRIVKMPDDRV